MTNLLRALFVPVLGLATLLPAQDDKAKGQEPKAQEPKAEAKPEAKPAPAVDDAATAADKAVKAVDAFLAEKKLDKANARWAPRGASPWRSRTRPAAARGKPSTSTPKRPTCSA